MAKESKVQVQVETTDVTVENVNADVEVKAEEVVSPVVVVEPTTKKVKIKARTNIRIFIGDKWFVMDKGEERTVDSHIKEILMERGALDVL